MGVEELIQPAAMHIGGVRNRLLAAPNPERRQHHRPAPSKELINHPLRLRQLGSNLLELNQVVRTSRHTHPPFLRSGTRPGVPVCYRDHLLSVLKRTVTPC